MTRPVKVHALPVALIFLITLPSVLSALTSKELLTEINVHSKTEEFAAWVRNWRRELHSTPELGYNEHETAAKLKSALKTMGIDAKPYATTGFIAEIGTGNKPVVALRADMDALPITEETELPFASKIAGTMHACGHDAHMAMLLGAAKILKSFENELPGTVRLIFQPAEEGRGGGREMVRQGALDNVEFVFALHVDPALPSGHVRTRAEAIMAASDRFIARVQGTGGHGAAPHLTKDPIVAASATVLALQPLISRETDPMESAVVTVGHMLSSGSGAPNVVPEEVQLVGTIRAFKNTTANVLRQRVEEVISGTASVYGCTSAVQWSEVPYPPVINDARAVQLALQAAQSVVIGDDTNAAAADKRVGIMDKPYTYAEDFAFMAEAATGALVFLGVRNEAIGAVYGLHHPKFTIDEAVLPTGSALHAAFAVESLLEVTKRVESGSKDEL